MRKHKWDTKRKNIRNALQKEREREREKIDWSPYCICIALAVGVRHLVNLQAKREVFNSALQQARSSSDASNEDDLFYERRHRKASWMKTRHAVSVSFNKSTWSFESIWFALISPHRIIQNDHADLFKHTKRRCVKQLISHDSTRCRDLGLFLTRTRGYIWGLVKMYVMFVHIVAVQHTYATLHSLQANVLGSLLLRRSVTNSRWEKATYRKRTQNRRSVWWNFKKQLR